MKEKRINMNKEISSFIDRYVKEIKNNSAAMFIGAGFSKSAGYVDWKNLLKDVADDLELDIDKEYDLVSLAQYCYNKNGNRSIINDLIFDEFNKEKGIDENHRIIARLPIFTYWTTNYDSLIEEALEEAQRIVDIKYNNKQLSLTKPHRDAVVYKMHGDKNNPDEAILIKDDYEKYYREHAQFITALSGDLISKTFLFIGFSFSDPNIDYILSRVRIDYGEQNNRQHYAIMRRVNEKDYNNRAEYEYAQRKHEFFIEDLKRYNIRALLIDEYKEITDILNEIDKRLNHNNVFISGSAQEYGKYTEKEALEFIESLSKELILQDFNIISGFGLGVGSAVIIGALQEIYMKRNWTAVDAAEDEDKQEIVRKVNVLGTENIAKVCKKLGIKMMYLSTDYVFDGQGTTPWEPDCKAYKPLNVYGQTKLDGELAVYNNVDKFFIIRIAWVFGKNGKNFIKTMLNVAKTHDTLKVVDDQIGTPTYTYDLARLMIDMILTDKYGYYHATNEGGYISWYDFTKEIFRQAVELGHTEYAEDKVTVLPVTTAEYGVSKAARPFNSRLDKKKLVENGFTPLPTWQNALARYLKEIEF